VNAAFHAVETAAGLSFGARGVPYLGRYPTASARSRWLRLAAAVCATLWVAGVGASILPDLA
jgi:hypothetical protein